MRMTAVAALGIFAFVAGQQPAEKSISSFDRGASLTMLRQVKTDLQQNYYDVEFRGMDVEKVFAEAE